MVILADLGRLPYPVKFFIEQAPYGDKVGHFILFGALNFFVVRAARDAKGKTLWAVIFLSLMVAVLVAIEEYSQNYFADRTPDWVDLFSGYAGMILGAFIALKQR